MKIGHVHLKVADIDRSLAFWCDLIGFQLIMRMPGAAFISDEGYHHHLGLNTWESKGGSPPPRGTTGLYHVAVLFDERRKLAETVMRVLQAGVPLTGASDHGVSEAIYLNDPDRNGVELYWDRPRDQWPRRADGGIDIYTAPLDLEGLLSEAQPA